MKGHAMDAYCLEPHELPDLTIETLGPPTIDYTERRGKCHFVQDSEKVLVYSDYDAFSAAKNNGNSPPMFEKAGLRRKIFFDPETLKCGIVTCGGLCPGLNDVVRTITLTLTWQYGVKTIFGFRYGYAGLSQRATAEPVLLNPEIVDEIHLKGGNILSSSRGPQDPERMIDNLQQRGINLLFCIGGDGTLRGAADLCRVIKQRNLQMSIIGVPKTIDNDILGTERSFGFSTAVEATRAAIGAAHAEAKGAWNGVALVKLMGRDSGFIAAYATLANSDVNFCFIPETPLVLEGQNGFLSLLEKRLDKRHHAVIVVAEGAGQNYTTDEHTTQTDASGNIVRGDIGLFMKQKIKQYFNDKQKPIALKYIDPSYMIRSLPTDANDAAFCLMLGQNAVHAGISGRTNMVVGYWNQYFTHFPIALATMRRKKVDPNGDLWQTVLATTGQART
jgi:6-phosphofructokinase 1